MTNMSRENREKASIAKAKWARYGVCLSCGRHRSLKPLATCQSEYHILRYRKTKERHPSIRIRGNCEICGEVTLLDRDHNHLTGKLRGLLCHMCNMRLWLFELPAFADFMKKATNYLENWGKKKSQ